jgi:hypothetical protein
LGKDRGQCNVCQGLETFPLPPALAVHGFALGRKNELCRVQRAKLYFIISGRIVNWCSLENGQNWVYCTGVIY